MKNIFVGNLDFEATETELRSLFEPYGAIKRISIVRHRDSGQSKGFGFVEMRMDADGDRAITQLNGRETSGRALDVHAARERIHQGK
ncbi:MAG TPA: RNA-binding protein [Bryobacteraceae bacterium]|nr:RNA-binding protein [Bryobacteraceae bacterium]